MNHIRRCRYTTHLLSLLIILAAGIFIGSRWYYYLPWHARITKAVAIIHPTKGNTTEGIVTFTQEKSGVRVTVSCNNLTPGKHGFHIHEHGDCSCADGMCTGDHFNPTSSKHGGPTSIERHVGDFGNL